MKSHVFIVIVLLAMHGHTIMAQSFEIPVYFEDSAGYKDTVILGYDVLASYAIDPGFGEIDLLDSAYHDDFEVRAAIYDYYNEWPMLPRIIESKKMIIGYVCHDPLYFDEANSIMVVIKSHNWPVKLSWDSDLFQETCNRLDIIDCTPGGWFDVCGGGHPYSLLEMNSTDTATYYSSEFIIETVKDTLYALFFRFYKFGVGIEDASNKEITIFPNPTERFVQLNTPLSASDEIRITDMMGRPVKFGFDGGQVDLLGVPDGMYLLTLRMQMGESISMKILKVSS